MTDDQTNVSALNCAQTPKGVVLQRLVRALRRIERDWPKDYWLFAASGTLTLMKKKDGARKVDPKTGGMDVNQTVATFKGIECDGGDW